MGDIAPTSPLVIIKSSDWMYAFDTIKIIVVEVPLVVEIDMEGVIEQLQFSFGHINFES